MPAVAVLDWPKVIHDGGGKAVFVVPAENSDQQVDALGQGLFTPSRGGLPREILANDVEGGRDRPRPARN